MHARDLSAVETLHIDSIAIDLADSVMLHDRGLALESSQTVIEQDLLFSEIRRYVDANLADPDLTSSQVASAHHISVRHLQRLFKAVGTTPSGWIRRRRLEACQRELRDPALRTLSIQEVGIRGGFLLASDFSRAFRARYGVPPGKFRDEWFGRDASR
ncbi:helix-turn-helix transcriptional regulator [Nocardia sp. NPDC051570]|uniref:helix-turn-helix transcriptional regulator n=1 Tax=Nocardia sp. NPDC051570 TaxID=3364324 RepID=UPI0037872838